MSGSSAWNIANDSIQRVGNIDIHLIATRVKVDKQYFTVSPEQAQTWYSALQKRIQESNSQLQQELAATQKSGETTVFLDGTTYELSFAQELTQVRWTVMDEEVDDTKPVGHSTIVRWMNEIRLYAVNHVPAKGHA